MIKTIAVDDEPIALDIIRDHTEKIAFIDLKKAFLSTTEALAFIQQEPVDLVFLDINMPDLSGLEFAGLVPPHMQIVFTTAFPEYALNGFELAATDYLLKPINFGRFLKACQLAEKRLAIPVPEASAKPDSLFVKDGYNWVRINFDNLLYAQADDNYVSIFEPQKRTLTRMGLSKLLVKLPAGQFIQVHKSFIVAISKIEKVENNQLLIAGKKIPISASFKESFLKTLNKLE